LVVDIVLHKQSVRRTFRVVQRLPGQDRVVGARKLCTHDLQAIAIQHQVMAAEQPIEAAILHAQEHGLPKDALGVFKRTIERLLERCQSMGFLAVLIGRQAQARQSTFNRRQHTQAAGQGIGLILRIGKDHAQRIVTSGQVLHGLFEHAFVHRPG